MKNLSKIFVLSIILVGSLFFANNASALTGITVQASVSPTSVASGNPVTLTWSSTIATTCAITVNAGGVPIGINNTLPLPFVPSTFLQKFASLLGIKEAEAATPSGSVVYNPTQTTTYTVTCSRSGYTSVAASATVTIGGGGPNPSGVLNANDCPVQAGYNSCNSQINWSVANPIANAISRVVTTPWNTDVIAPTSLTSGSTTYPITIVGDDTNQYRTATRSFRLFYNGVQLSSDSATASCTSGTLWNGMNCDSNVYALSTESAGTGTGSFTGSGNYLLNRTAYITATPSSGSTFAGWTGLSCSGPSGCSWVYDADCNDGQVTMNRTVRCIGTFNLISQTVTVTLTKKDNPSKNLVKKSSSDSSGIGTAYLVVNVSGLTSGGCILKNNTDGTTYGTFYNNLSPQPKNVSSLQNNSNDFQLDCTNSSSPTTKSAIQNVLAQSGTLAATYSPACTISSGQGSCNIPMNWGTTNPKSGVTTTLTGGTSVVSGNSGSNTNVTFSGSAISVGGTSGTVTLTSKNKVDGENNGTSVDNILASLPITVSCSQTPVATSWNGSVCAPVGVIPTVTSPTATSVTCNSATVGANVTSLGVPATLSARGTSVTIGSPGTCVDQGGRTTGVYTMSKTGLTPSTIYYVYGCATNTTGTGWTVTPASFTTPACPAPNLTASAPTPSSAYINVAQTFTSTITNNGNASTGASFSNFFQVASSANGGGTITDKTSTSMTTLAASGTNTISVSHIFSSAGTYSIRVCADKTSAAGGGVITESNEGDNCSSWTNVPVPVDSCGPGSGSTPQNPEPTGTSACTIGTLNSSSPVDTSLLWKWTCGTVTTCSAPKYGCTTATDTNYNATGPSNIYGCSLICSNGASNYPTCTTCPPGSAIIGGICTSVTVSVTASPTTYNTTPNTNVSFTYTPTTNSGLVQCKLLDNNQADLTAYASATKDVVNTKTYASPNGIGAYGYYIRCQNTTTTAVGTSGLITVNTACATGSDFVSGACRVRPTITASSGANGTVTPTGVTSVAYGSNQIYTITPITNYSIASLTVDGSAITVANSYTFSNITANHTISATFTPTACANGATNPPTCTTCVAGSVIIAGTCTSVTVSVTASPLTYNTTPNTNVSFTYTPTTNSGLVQCKLLDNNQTDLTAYTSATKDVINTKTYTSPNGIGAYGYYIRCQNTTTTTAVGTSGLITVNTECPVNTTLGNGICNPPSGTLTINPLSCKIGEGESSCPVNISWNTIYPVNSVSAVTTEPSNTIVGGGGTGVSSTNAGAVNYNVGNTSVSGGRIFYLYHNGVELKRETVNADCTDTPQTFWDGSKCVTPSGTLSSGGCSITEGNSSCNDAQLDWAVTNKIGNSRVDASYGTSPIVPSTTAVSGTATFSLVYGVEKILTLYSGALSLKTLSVTAGCAPTTHWQLLPLPAKCVIDAPSDTTIFEANPSTIFEGRSSTLAWDSPLADSCTGTGFDTGGTKQGTRIVSPIVTTTYILTCSNTSGSKEKTVVTKVITLIIKEQ
ncbi:MAG: CARDB domain-containing protein [Candidatus Paceibacterota bacterium]